MFRTRSPGWWLLRAVAGVVVVALLAFGLQYRRQVVSYATHLRGSPTSTDPYEPFPDDDPPVLRLAVAGDIGDSGSRLDATADAIAELGAQDPYDYLWILGDNVYPTGDPAGLQNTVFGPFQQVLDEGSELLAVVGNHDEPYTDEQLALLGMPGPWWSVEREGVLLVGLDSNRVGDPAQRRWLEATLRRSSAGWKIVSVHHPPYSAGYQGSSEEVRAAFSPLFSRYGVQLVLSGHDHDYQRSHMIDGVTYVVTGAGSGTRRTGEEAFTAVAFSWHSFVEIGVYPDRIVGRAINQDARVADEWVLRPNPVR